MTRFRTESGERVVATRDEHGQLWLDVSHGTGETRRYGPLTPERDEGRGPAGRPRASSADGSDSLHARSAGQVARVHVSAGDAVAAGALLLVMELMKMEVELRAPRDGRVAELHVAPGDVVARGALLLRLAPG